MNPDYNPDINTEGGKSFEKKLFIPLGIILSVVLILGGYILLNRDVPDEDISTENWQTYRNEEYGFQTVYPQNWLYQEHKGTKNNFTVNFASPEYFEIISRDNFAGDIQSEVTINVYSSVSDLDSSNGFEVLTDYINHVSLSPDIEIESTTDDRWCYSTDVFVTQTRCLFEHAGYIFETIDWGSGIKDQDDLIIESLQLFDITSTWQTYRNEEFGFEFKYPEDWEFNNNSPYGDVSFGTEGSFVKTEQVGDYTPPIDITFYQSMREFDPEVSSVEEYMQQYFGFLNNIDYINTDQFVWVCGEVDGVGFNMDCFLDTNEGTIVHVHLRIKDEISDRILSTFKFIE